MGWRLSPAVPPATAVTGLGLAQAVALGLVVPATALAHAAPVGLDPAHGAALAEPPAAIRMVFSEPIEARFSRIEVRRGSRFVPDLEPPRSDGPLALVQPLPPLEAGPYTVQWRVLATDGHVTEGSYGFTVTAGAAPAGAAIGATAGVPGASGATAGAAGASGAATDATAGAAEAPDAGAGWGQPSPAWQWILALAGLSTGAALLFYFHRTRPGPAGPPPGRAGAGRTAFAGGAGHGHHRNRQDP